jgi:hypothetical protein
MLSGVETHPQLASGDSSFTSFPCGLAVSYDLINFVKKLHKVRKNPERALHVVGSDLANFFGFHRFGIKESAVMPQRGREGAHLGRVFVSHGIKLNCEVWGDGSTDLVSSLPNPGARFLLKSKTKLAIDNQLSANLFSGGMLRRPTMPCLPTDPRHRS